MIIFRIQEKNMYTKCKMNIFSFEIKKMHTTIDANYNKKKCNYTLHYIDAPLKT